MTIQAVDVEGSFRGAYGYDRHLRAFVREFRRRGIAVRLYDAGDRKIAPIAASWQDPFYETLNRSVGARVLLQSRMPHNTRFSGTQALVNLTTFEATGVPRDWVARSRWHTRTVVTTEQCRQAWLDSGAPADRVRVCHLGVDAGAFSGSVEPLWLRLATGQPVERFRTRFLNVAALCPRKNLTGLMRCWLRATTRHDDAVLIQKLTIYSSSEFAFYLRQLDQIQHELGKRFDDAAPVHTILRVFPDRDVPRLFAAATHYISLSHGEGWDLPMLEAAASGLRLIAPDHSAYQTYLDADIARLLPSHEIPVVFPYRGPTERLFRGLNWWQPDEDAAVAAIRDAIADRDAPNASARERVCREFTWERATDRMVEILTEAEALAPARRWWTGLQSYIEHRTARQLGLPGVARG
jgi:glycosyltransferase involved in cell wall biosynthesis